MKKQVHQDVFIGIVCLGLCVLIYALNTSLPRDAALMPMLLDGMLAVLSVLIIHQGIVKSKAPVEKQKKLLTWDGLKIPLITWGLVGLYLALFYFVGYFIATAVMIPVLMRFMKQTSWKLILLIDACYLVVIYAVFVRMLGVAIDGFGILSRFF